MFKFAIPNFRNESSGLYFCENISMNKLLSVFLLIVIGLNFGAAQPNDEDALRKRIIKGIADYRTELVNNTYDNLDEYIKVSLEKSGNDYDETLKIVKNLSLKELKKKYPNKSLYEDFRKYQLGQKSIFRSFSPIEMKIVGENLDLFGLVFQQILKPNFPYGINPKTAFMDEVVFIDIKDGDRIADLGAGSGEISFLWSIIFKELELYMTEIGEVQLEVMNFKSKKIECIDTSNAIHILKGTKKETGLEGKNLDKIVVRLSFHHFKKKKAMLASIKRSLKHDGELILIESEPYFKFDHKMGCEKAMFQPEIESILKKNGFTLIDSERDEQAIYLKYKIAN